MDESIVKYADLLSNMPAMIRFDYHGIGQFDARRRIGPASWPHFDLLWIHSGRVQIQFMNRHEVKLSGGSGVLIFPETFFSGECLSKVSRASVQHFAFVPRIEVQQLPQPMRRLVGQRCGYERYRLRHPGRLEQDIERAVAWAFQRSSPMLHDMRLAQLTVILGQLASQISHSRVDEPRSVALDMLRDWMAERLDQPVSLGQMAERMGLSPSHFRAAFTRHFQLSPGQFLLRLRLQAAGKMLRETNTPIKIIAGRVGYRDLANFYRAFRLGIGMTPKGYRQRYSPRG